MTSYYKPIRTKNIYDPASSKPFRLSRSKIDNFLNCPRCFYIDRRLGVGQPPGYPFNLNSAVDVLLKKEFDYYRKLGKPHPLMIKNQIDAIPYQHEKIELWREPLRGGVEYAFPNTNLLLTGGVDDVWVDPKGILIIVDYKATSKDGEVSIEAEWQIGYKRQMEIYQWLFRKNGFEVCDRGYFVYCNGLKSAERFDGCLKFDIALISYDGCDAWIDTTIEEIYACLCSDSVPDPSNQCDYCNYIAAIRNVEN